MDGLILLYVENLGYGIYKIFDFINKKKTNRKPPMSKKLL